MPNMLICIDLLTLLLHLKLRQSLLFSTWTVKLLFNLSNSMIIHAKHHEKWIGNSSNDPRRIWYRCMLLFQWGNIFYMRRFCNDFPQRIPVIGGGTVGSWTTLVLLHFPLLWPQAVMYELHLYWSTFGRWCWAGSWQDALFFFLFFYIKNNSILKWPWKGIWHCIWHCRCLHTVHFYLSKPHGYLFLQVKDNQVQVNKKKREIQL